MPAAMETLAMNKRAYNAKCRPMLGPSAECVRNQTARLKCACLNRSNSSAGMRHRRQTRMAVMLREVQSARMVFGANLSCAAASSVVRRFDNVGLTPRSGSVDAVLMNQTCFLERISWTSRSRVSA